MFIPPKIKTWQFAFNRSNLISNVVQTDAANVMLLMVNNLLAFPLFPWIVVGSSDGLTAGLDGVNRWTDITKLVAANPGSSHSWIVLRQPGIGPTFYLLIDFPTLSGGLTAMRCYAAFNAPFTGGSTTNRPTAVGEQTEAATSNDWLQNQGAAQYRVHLMESTDGQCTRVIIYCHNIPTFYMMADRIQGTHANWTTPYMFGAKLTGPIAGNADYLMDCDNLASWNTKWMSAQGSLPMYLTWAIEATSGGLASPIVMLQNYKNEISGEYLFQPLSVMHPPTGTVGLRGVHGEIADFWFIPRAVPHGAALPQDGSKQCFVAGDAVFPHDGVTKVLTS